MGLLHFQSYSSGDQREVWCLSHLDGDTQMWGILVRWGLAAQAVQNSLEAQQRSKKFIEYKLQG